METCGVQRQRVDAPPADLARRLLTSSLRAAVQRQVDGREVAVAAWAAGARRASWTSPIGGAKVLRKYLGKEDVVCTEVQRIVDNAARVGGKECLPAEKKDAHGDADPDDEDEGDWRAGGDAWPPVDEVAESGKVYLRTVSVTSFAEITVAAQFRIAVVQTVHDDAEGSTWLSVAWRCIFRGKVVKNLIEKQMVATTKSAVEALLALAATTKTSSEPAGVASVASVAVPPPAAVPADDPASPASEEARAKREEARVKRAEERARRKEELAAKRERRAAEDRAEREKEDKAKEDKAREDKAREDKAREDKAREDKAREDKAKEDKAREDKAREDKAREDKAKADQDKAKEENAAGPSPGDGAKMSRADRLAKLRERAAAREAAKAKREEDNATAKAKREAEHAAAKAKHAEEHGKPVIELPHGNLPLAATKERRGLPSRHANHTRSSSAALDQRPTPVSRMSTMPELLPEAMASTAPKSRTPTKSKPRVSANPLKSSVFERIHAVLERVVRDPTADSSIALNCNITLGPDAELGLFSVAIATPLVSWTMTKDYADFAALHELLSKTTSNLPYFPAEDLFRTNNATLQDGRRALLEEYLRGLVEDHTVLAERRALLESGRLDAFLRLDTIVRSKAFKALEKHDAKLLT